MLKIGDKIRVTSPFNSTIYEIFRVTKTKAVGKSYDGGECSFYKEGTLRTYPRELYNFNECKLLK